MAGAHNAFYRGVGPIGPRQLSEISCSLAVGVVQRWEHALQSPDKEGYLSQSVSLCVCVCVAFVRAFIPRVRACVHLRVSLSLSLSLYRASETYLA